jgi:hypothetical protein
MNNFCRDYRQVRILRPGELKPPTDGGKTLWLKFMPSEEYFESRRRLEEEAEIERDGTVGAARAAIDGIDWRPKAERRGIRRAAIEYGLNILCANHEQHRLKDKFRRVELPGPYVSTDLPEISLSLPLEPYERPVEMDTFEYTKQVARYHHDLDLAYSAAREKVNKYDAIELPPPVNHRGPFEVGTAELMLELFQAKVNSLYKTYQLLNDAAQRAPRPIIERMLSRVEEGIHLEPEDKHEFMIMRPDENGKEMEVVDLSKAELGLFDELVTKSWDELRKPFTREFLPGRTCKNILDLKKFAQEVDQLVDIPIWAPARPKRLSEIKMEQFEQRPHDSQARGEMD